MMDHLLYFEEYSLSNDSMTKLKTNNELLKQNVQLPEAAWSTLFKIENEERSIIKDENDTSIDVNDNNDSQNPVPEDDEKIISSQFISTQIEPKKKHLVIPQVIHQEHGSELINIVDSIYEQLEDSNGILNSDDFQNLKHVDIDEIMERLSQQLSINGIYNLCNSLCNLEIDITMEFVKTICSKILLQRIIELEKSQQAANIIPKIIDKMTEKFPEDIYRWIFIPMINADIKDTTVILTIVKFFMGQRKLLLINDFLITAKELKLWHTAILTLIIDIKIDDKTKDRLLTLLVDKASIFSNDKNYSKFILSFIKSNSPFSESQLRMLDEIIAVNTTIFKTPMKITLQNL
ncbi:hypothetical protein PV328_002211 [Microctonus aethiopoides]|uniref:Fanconi Anaemia group E protein C-terminal domain-containing protein n=1 Tax=Microctonus aethiopoides TaxID=144406 RepID=A0AA39KYA4_9HYME|nr:hypothetical protein PV328_002211 [Microctonus aethiopoides]